MRDASRKKRSGPRRNASSCFLQKLSQFEPETPSIALALMPGVGLGRFDNVARAIAGSALMRKQTGGTSDKKTPARPVHRLGRERCRVLHQIEGREPLDWNENDYAMVEETRIGRTYRHQVSTGWKWLWFLQTAPAPFPNNGVADTLDEGKATLVKRYEQVKGSETQ
jgi:hypothetical protein